MSRHKSILNTMRPFNKYLVASVLFFSLLLLNNCGGGGGSGSPSVLDLMSANDIEVTTINDETGMLLGNVFLSIAEVGNETTIIKSASTGDAGVYIFSKIKIGSYIINASKSGYESTSANVIVTNGPQKVTIRVVPSFPPDSISGKVVRSDTQAGVQDVTVEIKDSSPIIKGITDVNGGYVLRNVQPTGNNAPYILKASKIGFKPEEKSGVIKLPNVALKNVDITLQSSGSSEAMLPGKIIGVVKSKATNEPIGQVDVKLQGSDLPVSSSDINTGYFSIDNVPAGKTYILTAVENTQTKKFKAFSQQVMLDSEQTLVQDIMMDPIEVTPAPTLGYIVGTVVDSVTKAAISGVSVELLGTSFYDLTKANGSFKVSNVTPETEYIMLFSKTGYQSQTMKRTVDPNANNLDQVEMTSVASAQNYGSIIGVVSDDDTDVEVPGAVIEVLVPDTNAVSFTRLSTTASSRGEFVFTNVYVPSTKVTTGQDMTMIISRSDYVSKTLTINVKGSSVNSIPIDQTQIIKLKGNILGKTIDADTNLPVSGAQVALANFSYPSITNPSPSSTSGEFRFFNIPIGTYTIQVAAQGYATTFKNGVTLTYNGQTIGPFDIQLKKDFGTVVGYVYIETNGSTGFQSGVGGDTPLSGITVSAGSQASSGGGTGGGTGTTALATDVTKNDGSYTLTNLPLSSLKITANAGSTAIARYNSYSADYTVVKGYQNLNIDLAQSTGIISGIVFEDVNRNGAFDNEPLIDNADVSVVQSGSTITTKTDGLGNFLLDRIDVSNDSNTLVTASKTNYNSSNKSVAVKKNTNTSNVYIGLYRPTGKLAGRVIEEPVGTTVKRGVANVVVKISGFSSYNTTTDSTGSYVFNNVPARNGGASGYTIIADGLSLGYAVNAETTTDAPDEGALVNVPEIQLSKDQRNVSGKVIDSVTKAGIAGIRVQTQATATAYTATTDVFGVYMLPNVPVSTTSSYTLNYDDTIITNGAVRYKNRSDVNVTVNANLRVQDIELTPNLGKIRGTIYDSISGQPLNWSFFSDPVQVQLTGGGFTAATPLIVNPGATSGEFTMDSVPPGTYVLKIAHVITGSNTLMFQDVNINTLVTSGQTTDLGVIYVTMKRNRVYGNIRDLYVSDYITAHPGTSVQQYNIPSAAISVATVQMPKTYSSTTNAAGYYEMDVPVTLHRDWTISASGYDNLTVREYYVAAGSSTPQYSESKITRVTEVAELTRGLSPKKGFITGTVYLDSNNNGYYDIGDTVKIKDANSKFMSGTFTISMNYRGVPVQATVDSGSAFSVEVPVGDYYIMATPPSANVDAAYAELNQTSWMDQSGNRKVTVAANATTSINAVITKTAYPTGSISGRIVDLTKLDPISGAAVKITSNRNKNSIVNLTTDNSGYFSVTNLVYYTNESDTTESFSINVSKSSYVTQSLTYTMARTPDASREIFIDSRLNRGVGSISGRVVDSQNLALADVYVRTSGALVYENNTLTNGFYTLDNIPTGTYDLFFTKITNGQVDPDYSTYRLTGVSIVEDNTVKTVSDVVLDKNFGSISGVVYLEVNNVSGYQAGQDKPLSDISVSGSATINGNPVTINSVSHPEGATTKPDGTYKFDNLRFGSYTLTFTSAATATDVYTSLPVVVNVTTKTPYTQNVSMQAKTGDIAGVVFDDENGNGIKDGAEQGITGIDVALSTVFGTFTATPTTVGGEYKFKNLNAVNGSITVSNNTNTKSYQQKVVYQTITAGVETRLDIPMKRNTVKITGRVIDADNSNAIANVNILIGGTTYSAVTGSDGRFTINNVVINASGTTTFDNVLFEADSLGYQQKIVNGLNTTGADITMADTKLDRATRKIRGRVINSDGNGVIGATIKLVNKPATTTNSDSFGYFILDTVSVDLNNQTDLEISATDYEISFKSFYLGVGTTRYEISPDITLTSSNAKITGTVIDSLTGGPVTSPNFTITVGITQGTVTKSTTVSSNGNFTLSGIPKGGPYDFIIRSNGGANTHFDDVIKSVTLSAGQNYNIGTQYIVLKTVPVKGTIYDDKVYSLAASANDLARAGLQDAVVTAKYKRYDGSYYQVSSAPSLSGGSFEVYLPSLRFEFEVARTNFIRQSFPNININSYPNATTGQDFRIKPQSVSAYGKIYFDENRNGYVDATEQPLFTYNGGVFQGLNSSLIVTYSYNTFTFDTQILSDSSFVIPDVPIAPDGTKVFTVSDRSGSNRVMQSTWMDSSGNTSVIVNSTGTMPDPINIAVPPSDSQYTTYLGQVYDSKIWNEGFNLYNGSAGYNRNNTNYSISGATVRFTSANYSQTFTTQPNGSFLARVPAGQTYTVYYSATGYTDTSESGLVASAGATARIEGQLYPKFGNVAGAIYYDNNLNSINSEPTDYNHLHEASEPYINAVVGHPTTSSNWSGATFNVSYSYRGLTFGTTAFDRANSRYMIEKVPIGSYYNFRAQDVSSLSNWTGVGTDITTRSFMNQIYTVDGKNPGAVNVNENSTTINIDFAVMVWGGHIVGTRMVDSSGANQEYSPGIFNRNTATNYRTRLRGSDYWMALGGSLNITDGLALPRKYYLELFDVRDGGSGGSGIKKISFTDAQGFIEMKSYPVGSDPDFIIPPGNYVLAIAGDVDLSPEPITVFDAGTGSGNSDLLFMTWDTSVTGFPYRYGPRTTPQNFNLLKDRCNNSIFYYRGGTTATSITINAGQSHVIQ